MEKSYKFRIYPNKEQRILFAKTFGCSRFVYNYFLNRRIEAYQNNEEKPNCSAELTNLKKQEEYKWLNEVPMVILQQTLRNLDSAYQNFFKEHKGFPKFKKKKSTRQSCRFSNSHYISRIEDESHIWLSKFGKVKCKFDRKIEGKIMNMTISKNSCNQYFVSICCSEVEIPKLETNENQVGIDLGIKDFAIFSNGTKIENPKFYQKEEKKLKKFQKQLSKKVKGSHNYEKQRLKLAKVSVHIANQRTDFLQKLSTQIINENQIICLEDLNVSGMLKNHKLAKQIQDCSWSEFVRMLEYKANWCGRIISKISTFYPSSKTCSYCGCINEDLTLADRIWTCSCGVTHDRDVNAAKNILIQGLALIS